MGAPVGENFWNGIPGLYRLCDLPQQESVSSSSRSTGYWELDQIYRVYPGQFTVVHGPTNAGKSTFLFNLICNQWIEHEAKCFVYFPENEGNIHERLATIYGDRLGWDDFAAGGLIVASAHRRFTQQPHDMDWILERAYDAFKKGQVGLVVLDPWNEIEWTKPRDLDSSEFYGKILQKITGFCRELNTSLILSCHPTKSGVSDQKVPGVYDIAGSAHFANKPDNILCVFRGDKSTQVFSQKVRQPGAGKRGVCVFDVDENTGLFTPQKGGVSL